MSLTLLGILGCFVLLILLGLSMPVGFALAVVGCGGYALVIGDLAGAGHLLLSSCYETFSKYDLSVIPLFIFMGQITFHAGISRRLYDAAYHWLSWLPGGLAMATVGACTAFGAICGSGPATAATMSAVALPEMRRRGYDLSLGSGTVAAGGSLGMLIPPSVVFIVYGILTEQSIGKLFIAGIVPGLLIAALFCAVVAIQCALDPAAGPASARQPLRARLAALGDVTETLLLFALVIGGMFAGWFTPTEGAAVGAAGSLLVAAFSRKLTWRLVARALEETIRTSCMVLIIVAGASVFGHFLAVTEIPSLLAKWLAGLPLPSWVVILIVGLFYLVAGCFVDSLALVMLTVPIFYPVILRLGYSPVWFGVLVVVITQMGVITPPVGVNVYVVSGIDRSIPIQTIFRGALPFLLALLAAALLLIFFPAIATWLPGVAG